MHYIGYLLCSVGLLVFVVSGLAYAFHRRYLVRLVDEMFTLEHLDDPDFDFRRFMHYN